MTPDRLPPSRSTRSSAPTTSPVVAIDLDTQIEQLEKRLVAREAWLRSTAESLALRAQHAVTPKLWVLPVVGVGVAVWLGWRWWHRRDAPRQVSVPAPGPVPEQRLDSLTDLPWAGLAASGWPLLPVAWRGRLSPAAAAAIVSTVLSIGRRLLRRRIR